MTFLTALLLLPATLSLGLIGAAGAALLFVVAKKFEVPHDPRLQQILQTLPGANCGGCGFPGCAAFADACLGAHSLDALACPVGGPPVMQHLADILGLTPTAPAEPQIAVLFCDGTHDARQKTSLYDGAPRCAIVAALYAGETDCSFGCLGYGDCAAVCSFNAITLNPLTGLPQVHPHRCTACGACVSACPKGIIRLHSKAALSHQALIPCSNTDKGALCRKACSRSCIACSRCVKACPLNAIVLNDNLARIDTSKCNGCGSCAQACPQQIIRITQKETL